MNRVSAFVTVIVLVVAQGCATAYAATPAAMIAECRARAGQELNTRLPNIETKYEGQRTDGTHAVNGTARYQGRVETFQCSFDRKGSRIVRFVVNKASGNADVSTPETMKAICRARAGNELRVRLPDIETKYEGQRTDGTHAVNGTAYLVAGTRTFQCSFDRAGRTILRFVVNRN